MRLPLPLTPESRTSVVLLLSPEQAAWLRSHAGRRGVSSFMRRLLAQLMEDERREIERARRRFQRSQQKAEVPSGAR